MTENVGGISYSVTLDTQGLIDGQRKVDRELQKTSASLDNFSAKLTAVASAIALYAVAMQAVKAAQMADDMRLLAARVQVAAGSIQAGAEALRELEAISTRTQTSMEANADVFARLNQSMLQMGGTQRDTLQLTELLGKAITVSGASAIEAKSAMLQFGQALGSGKLAGDELRSLMESAPYLMRQLADGIGVPVGALKKLGEEGKLTSDVVVNALGQAAAKIDADFRQFPKTIDASMTVASDAAKRAAEAFDNATGTSAVLTGAADGLGKVLDNLAKQFGKGSTEADKLGRNKTVESWSKATTTALSYLADAADVTWQALSVLGRNVSFVFQGMGAEIGGIGAQVAAVMRGDFSQAKAIGDMMKADSDQRRRELDAKDKETLKDRLLAGQRMRQELEKQAAQPAETTKTTFTKLKPQAQDGDKKAKKSGATFDAIGYLSGLEAKSADAMQKIAIVESEAKRKADELLEQKKLSREQHEKAITLITADAEQARTQILEDQEQRRLDSLRKAQADRDRNDAEQSRAIGFAAGIINETEDPAEQIRQRFSARKTALDEALANELITEQLHGQAVIANRQAMNTALTDLDNQRTQATLQNGAQLFDGMAGIAKSFAGEQSGIYKAMFAASKAFAIADAIIKIQQGIASAAAAPWPMNIAAMAGVAASTTGIISTIKGTNYGGGRQYGGPVSAGTIYRVNEGGRPEMFTAANGNQYLMPTASGNVTPANEVGGGAPNLNVVIENHGNPVSEQSRTFDQQTNTVRIAVAEVASQISSNSGPVWSAMRGATNVRSAL